MLYQFDSELLRDYSNGDIITRADSVEEARQQILGWWLSNVLIGPHCCLYSEDDYIKEIDEAVENGDLLEWTEAWDDIVAPYRLLISDLAKEPKILPNNGVIFIDGSA